VEYKRFMIRFNLKIPNSTLLIQVVNVPFVENPLPRIQKNLKRVVFITLEEALEPTRKAKQSMFKLK
jgi:hypothetical protein